jgi:hypothetical protein
MSSEVGTGDYGAGSLPVQTILPSPRRCGLPRAPGRGVGVQDSYLVDSASSHMLVSKIKPCMSKYKQSIR